MMELVILNTSIYFTSYENKGADTVSLPASLTDDDFRPFLLSLNLEEGLTHNKSGPQCLY